MNVKKEQELNKIITSISQIIQCYMYFLGIH